MIGSVVNILSDPGGGALPEADSLDVTAPVDVAGASVVGFLFSPHAAIRAVAAAVPTPSSASLRRASRRDIRPSTWSVAISSAMYCCSGVTLASMRLNPEAGYPLPVSRNTQAREAPSNRKALHRRVAVVARGWQPDGWT